MKHTPFNIGLVIVCAGKGRRLGVDKATLKLSGKPLFYHSYSLFRKIKSIKQIIIVLRKEHIVLAKSSIKDKRVLCIKGGEERKDSVLNGLYALNKEINYVLVHDGARPFTSRKVIMKVIKELKKFPAVICGVKSKDTLKSSSGNFVKKTLNRKNIFLIQTPQGFKKEILLKAYDKLKGRNIFDDAQIIESAGGRVRIVEGSFSNIKITYPQDLFFARAILKSKRAKLQ